MLGDALLSADKTYNFKEIAKGPSFESLDDSIYSAILNSSSRDLENAKNILRRIENRNLYKQLWMGKFDEETSIESFIEDNHPNLRSTDIRYIEMKHDHCNGVESPLKNVIFKSNHIGEHPDNDNNVFEDKTVLIYSISNNT